MLLCNWCGSMHLCSSQLKVLLFSHSVMSDSLRPHGLQHARLHQVSPSSGVCSNSHPLSQGCHPTISSSVALFFFCPQSFQVSGSFPMSWFFASGGQSIVASVSASVFAKNIQGWFPLGLTGLISWWGSKIYILWVISLMARIWPSTLILYPSCWLEFKC